MKIPFRDLWTKSYYGDRFSIPEIIRYALVRLFICYWVGHEWTKDKGDSMSYCPRCWKLENRGDEE